MPRRTRLPLTADEIAGIPVSYTDGESSGSIAARLGVTPGTVFYFLRKAGTARRICSLRHALNEDAFVDAENHPEAAYFCGLLFADGNIGTRGNAVSLELSGEDGTLVERFRVFLGTTRKTISRPPRDGRPATTIIGVNSPKIVETLARYGVVPRKSLTAIPPVSMLLNRDWWRGVVDGDGHVEVTYLDRPGIGVSGTRETCEAFLAFARTITPTKAGTYPNNGIWMARLTAGPAYRVLKSLYENCIVALPRKQNKTQEILKQFAWLEAIVPDHTLTLNGETKTIPEWSLATGINKKTIWKRRRKGLPVEQILLP